jgi:hypothetical protein
MGQLVVQLPGCDAPSSLSPGDYPAATTAHLLLCCCCLCIAAAGTCASSVMAGRATMLRCAGNSSAGRQAYAIRINWVAQHAFSIVLCCNGISCISGAPLSARCAADQQQQQHIAKHLCHLWPAVKPNALPPAVIRVLALLRQQQLHKSSIRSSCRCPRCSRCSRQLVCCCLFLQFQASRQEAERSTLFQPPSSGCPCSSTCRLDKAQESAEATSLYVACRMWSTDINHFGPQHDSLRALYNNQNDRNSFHTTKSGVRVWPYRPRKAATTQTLIMYGLQTQSSAKCDDCFDRVKAELLSNALVLYG